MARSAIEPNWYWLQKIEKKGNGIQLILRIRWNIHQVTIEDMNKQTHTEYEYDEQILKHTPGQTLAKDEVTSYIESCKEELLTEAQNIAGIKEIAESDINNVRKQPLIPTFVRVKKKAKADIADNPIPDEIKSVPKNIKAIKTRIENIERILGLQ